jgi:methionyl-tRNA synthetase
MQEKKRYLITSALPYANGPLHIGHLAGAYLSADVYVRYLRLMGKDVVWVCGSDEHGAAITIRAMKEGLKPREIIDKYDAMFRHTFAGMGISFDIFHRTSEPIHHQTSQDFFRQLYKNDAFTVKESEQYFDEEKNAFLADRYILGTCPVCSNPDAYGDQCERCGTSLSPDELKDPIRSTLSGSTPVKRPTKHWYMKLNEYEAWLKRWITEGVLENPKDPEMSTQTHDPADWKPHVLGQCRSWLDQGLHPRAMTRDLDWGIAVPPEIDETGQKKLYVWLDAPIGYISATKEWAIRKGEPDLWKKYWQDEDTALIHFIGKDNIVFHCLIFPAMLKEHGGYILPANVPANQFMNLEGRKISTSKNWAVWVHEYLEDFAGKEDDLRYNMLRNMPELQDSEFTWKRFQETTNNELVANFANFIHRVLSLTQKFYGGKIPDAKGTEGVEKTILEAIRAMSQAIDKFDFRSALQVLMDLSTYGNQYMQTNAPWKTVQEDPNRTQIIMADCLDIVVALSVLCRPFLPFASDKMRAMLHLSPITEGVAALQNLIHDLEKGKPRLPKNHDIGIPTHLFTRITDAEIEAQIQKLKATDELNAAESVATTQAETSALAQTAKTVADENATPLHSKETLWARSPVGQYEALKSVISYDDFAKMDIRTGKVLAAEPMPKSDKLLKLTIDLGFETRTILSGIAKHFKPEDVIGKEVVVLANLAPRKMMGIESNGMVLMAENAGGTLGLVVPPADWMTGSTVK